MMKFMQTEVSFRPLLLDRSSSLIPGGFRYMIN